MKRLLAPMIVAIACWGCAMSTGPAERSAGGPAAPPPGRGAPQPVSVETTTNGNVNPQYAERLKRILPPLLAVMDHAEKASQIKVGIMNDDSINAANAGNGQFFVTKGLMDKANDEQLQAVLAHETAHEDLGHVAKAQTLGAGLNVAGALLANLFPITGAIAPIAGTLVERAYSRSEEYAADAHGVELLRRLQRPNPAQQMMHTLQWIEEQSGGGGGGGFLATHPGTPDRIERLKKLA
jgi:Zn-dependent protease with chaperone function